MKAILVNVEKNEVRNVEWNDIDDLNKLIGCELFTVVLPMCDGSFLFVDDEGYLNGTKNFFKFKSIPEMQWLAGNGVFIKENTDGTYGDVEIPIEAIREDVVFMNCDDEASCPVPPPIRVYSF